MDFSLKFNPYTFTITLKFTLTASPPDWQLVFLESVTTSSVLM